MRMQRMRTALAVAIAAGGAAAQQVPPPESGAATVNVTYANGQITMRDAANNTPLLMSRGMGLFDDRNIPGAVLPSVQVNTQPAGFDVVYTFRNEGSTPRPLANLDTGIVTLGRHVTYVDTREACADVQFDAQNFRVRSFGYPRQTYSPVTVLRNDDYAVGISLQYPILEYEHDCRINLKAPGGRLSRGEGGHGFQVIHRLSNTSGAGNATEIAHPASIHPGESRTYVVSVRVTKTPREWVRTLVPYRDFFRATYGGVSYVRDTTPINGAPMSLPDMVSRDNPSGFLGGADRPDLSGYADWVDRITARRGWKSYMLWNPAGMYSRGELDYRWPYQCATRLLTNPALASASDSREGLSSIAGPDRQLGIWFCRCVEVARTWDATEREDFDPDSPDHARLFLAEIDAATSLGATMIGLDTFSTDVTPIWKLYPWLQRLRRDYPSVRFGTEPISCDILHTLVPTYLRGTDDREGVAPSAIEDLYIIKNPHYLADFLLPGHEIWGGLRYGAFRQFNVAVTPAIVDRDMRELASWGFVPLIIGEHDCPGTYAVAESWKNTVPPDLQIGGGPVSPPNATPNQNAAPPDPHAQQPSEDADAPAATEADRKPAKHNSRAGTGFTREEAREAMRRYRETVRQKQPQR